MFDAVVRDPADGEASPAARSDLVASPFSSWPLAPSSSVTQRASMNRGDSEGSRFPRPLDADASTTSVLSRRPAVRGAPAAADLDLSRRCTRRSEWRDDGAIAADQSIEPPWTAARSAAQDHALSPAAPGARGGSSHSDDLNLRAPRASLASRA